MAFPANYNLYDEVTIDKDKVSGSSDHSNFPVYIDLSDMSAQFWANVSNGGGDIRVTESDGTTQLPREVVSCDTSGETGELWVNVTTLQYDADTVIKVWYNGSDTEPASDSTYGSENTWNSNYEGVWHWNNSLDDSTANGRNLTNSGSTDTTTSKIGSNARDFDNDYAYTPHINMPGAFTVSVWVKFDNLDEDVDRPFPWGFEDESNGATIYLDFSKLHPAEYPLLKTQSGGINYETGVYQITINTWYRIVAVYDGASEIKFYVNGVERGNNTSASFNDGTQEFYWGAGAQYGVDGGENKHRMDGQIDEGNVLTTNLSSDWISTEYNNQSSPSTFYSVIAKSKKQGFSKAYIF